MGNAVEELHFQIDLIVINLNFISQIELVPIILDSTAFG